MPSSSYAQSFVLLMGKDTIAVERFTRSADRLEGDLKTKGMGRRITYSMDFVDGMVSVLRTSAYEGDDNGALLQSAVLTFKGDSVIADITAEGKTVTQRIASVAGAFPFINPSFAMWEPVIERVHSMSADPVTVQLFTVSGGQTFPATIKRFGADSVNITIAGVSMSARVNERGDILEAAVPSQNLRVVRSNAALNLVMPKADYSAPAGAAYTAEEVRIKAPGGYTLAGTLTLPRKRAGRVPVVVTITGSGLQNRDEEIPIVHGYRPFRQIAEALAARGIGVLRCDDRGFGASTGNPGKATSADFAEDTRAEIAYLRTRSDVDSQNLFLLGHSEGGMIAPMIAATDASLRGIVLMAGPAWTGRKIIEYQNRYSIEHAANLTAAQRDSLTRAVAIQLDTIAPTQGWLKYFLAYDPLPTARRVRTPVLIMQGATDRQVTAEQAPELAAAFRQGGNKDVTVHVLPEVNHLFLADPDGNFVQYSSLSDAKVVANAVGIVTDWIIKHVRASPAHPTKRS